MRKQLLTAALATGLMFGLASAAAAQVFVPMGPPPVRRQAIPRRPHPGWVWQPGFQRWDGRSYIWMPGVWMAPPRRGAIWVPGRWRSTRRGWVWAPGRWR